MIDKGTVANLISGAVLVTGLILVQSDVGGGAAAVLLSVGMFAFSGGVTNAVAVKMLFDRIPGLYGSGVIQTRFAEIRQEIKALVLDQFFTETQLRDFIRERSESVDWFSYIRSEDGRGPLTSFVDKQWERLTGKDVIEPLLDQQVDKLLTGAVGGMLAIVGRDTIRNLVGNFVGGFIEAMHERVLDVAEGLQKDPTVLGLEFDEDKIVSKTRAEVESLLEHRLERLTPKEVKRIVEDVIRRHLGWLVVWGNVFGGLMGLLAPLISGR